MLASAIPSRRSAARHRRWYWGRKLPQPVYNSCSGIRHPQLRTETPYWGVDKHACIRACGLRNLYQCCNRVRAYQVRAETERRGQLGSKASSLHTTEMGDNAPSKFKNEKRPRGLSGRPPRIACVILLSKQPMSEVENRIIRPPL